MSRRLLFLLLATLAIVAPAAAATADPGTSSGTTNAGAAARTATIGGDRLATRGLVVDPLPGAPKLPQGITAASWLVADVDTGEILAAKAPHVKRLPASTLKILTALTLIPRLNAHDHVTVTNDDVNVDGSKVGLLPDASYTVAQLFTAMLVVSGNDAANALASAAGGTTQTLALMNAEAHRLQANDTVAKTPSGLDAPGQSTSAYDLALIAREALKLPDFRTYIGTVHSKIGAPGHRYFEIYTHNRLLTNYKGAIGVKNGYTVAAQATYVGAATRNGHTLLVSLMRGQPRFWHDAEPLLDWGFASLGKVSPVGELVDPLSSVDSAPAGAETGGGTDRHLTAANRAALHAAKPVAASNDGVSPMTIGLAGVSASIMIAVTTRRRMRSRRRLSLPPI